MAFFNSFPFDENSIYSKRAPIVLILSVLTILILGIDLYNEVTHGFMLLALLESFVIPVMILNLFFFLRFYNLLCASLILVSLISFLSIVSLQIDGFGKESALFWTASLPLYTFILLGRRRGLYLSIINSVAISLVLLIGTFEWLPPLFSEDILIQMLLGYVAISVLTYYFEKMRSDYEIRLNSSIKERDTLLREINHRVKNNMQIIISILRMQADQYGKEVKEVMTVAENRIRSMLSIHELLYKSDNFSNVDARLYITKLIAEVSRSFSFDDKKISSEIVETELSMDMLVQLGFIINELVTNAIKYANNPDGVKIHISLKKIEESIVLEVLDNGVSQASKTKEGLGTVFVRAVVEEQLRGSLEVSQKEGYRVKVTFPAENSRSVFGGKVGA